MANINAKLDIHHERHNHHMKLVPDNKYTAAANAAFKGIICCDVHPKHWVPYPTRKWIFFKAMEERACPDCPASANTRHPLEPMNSSRSLDHEDIPISSTRSSNSRDSEDSTNDNPAPSHHSAAETSPSPHVGVLTELNGVYVGGWIRFEDKCLACLSTKWKHGKGKYTWANGNVYDGDWKNDKMHGKGKYTWADGNVYDGNWKNDKMDGKGKYTWANGNVYEGGWKKDKKHGKGTYKLVNGDKYEEEWENDRKKEVSDSPTKSKVRVPVLGGIIGSFFDAARRLVSLVRRR